MNLKLKALNNFIGYGNPNSLYWFIGIDEQGDFKMSEENTELNKLSVFTESFNKSGMKPFSLIDKEFENNLTAREITILKKKADKDNTYKGMLQIYNLLNNTQFSGSFIGKQELDLFASNLFPIGRGSSSKEVYGPFVKKHLSVSNFTEWYDALWKSRKDAFKNFIEEKEILKSNKIFICLGVKYQIYFEELLSNLFNNKISLKRFEIINIQDKYQAILSYHPSKRSRAKYFTDDYARRIVDVIKKSHFVS